MTSRFLLTVLGLTLILQTCASPRFQFKKHKELESYRELIYLTSDGSIGKPINMFYIKPSVDDQGYRLMANCTKYKGLFPFSVINVVKSEWDNLSDIEKIILMTHELRHCQCDMEHNNSILEDGCPASIDHSIKPSVRCTWKHKELYLTQVIGGCSE